MDWIEMSLNWVEPPVSPASVGTSIMWTAGGYAEATNAIDSNAEGLYPWRNPQGLEDTGIYFPGYVPVIHSRV